MDPGRYILGGASRAEMEKERLARVAARQAAQQADGRDPSSVTGAVAGPSNNKPTGSSSSVRVATLSTIRASDETAPSLPQTQGNANSKPPGASKFGTLSSIAEKNKNTMYWNGIVRPTASRLHSGYECFTFADVVGNVSSTTQCFAEMIMRSDECFHRRTIWSLLF